MSQFSASLLPSAEDLSCRDFLTRTFDSFDQQGAMLTGISFVDGAVKIDGFAPSASLTLPQGWSLQTNTGGDLKLLDSHQRLVISGEAMDLNGLQIVLRWLDTQQSQVVGVRALGSLLTPGRVGALVFLLAGESVNREQVLALAEQSGLEANLLRSDTPRLSQPGLLLMDMDSTAIQIECIDEIAALAGVGQQVSEVTELAMQGKLDFAESLRARVSKLTDASEEILAEVAAGLPLTPGLEPLLEALKTKGWRTAIVSGGFTYFVDKLKADLALDEVRANVLEIIDGKLTGRVDGAIVDAAVKAEMLNAWAEQYGIAQAQTVAAGDGANDLKMMAAAALGVAFHAKPIVKAEAATGLSHGGLEGVYYLLAAADA